ncbi:RagB/SusD family nutrient uptake outer membrane protein [Pinibacter soli]|uniref:RagB/SusD family nutrient uptake outer membrane protein n=1 Tax=Pinibacter soli TaxID=3044211 RepID=A0ABT6R7H9_9BACT|nr:RagB/SusD family nutrient uptake outer membrane protein [Pinibacter soli]MDI3318520.1 RagB/SusD family nutrient uptake outer membrane protein [Pinibacter soli]
MKKITFKISVCLLIGSFILSTSCSKYIDVSPETKVPVANTDYSNISQMYMPVSGVYGTAATKFSFWAAQGLITVRGDDMNKGGSPNDQIEFSYCKNFQYDKIRSYWALDATWQGLYKTVSVANDALTALNEYAKHLTTDAQRQTNKSFAAEVRFLRAYAFFRISNFWGDVPLLLDNSSTASPKKTKLADVRTFILNEMDTCIANLPDMRPNERTDAKGAVTKYSALTLKAKVQLLIGDYPGVQASTDKIINSGRFTLYNDYYNLFKIPGKLSDESLYELQFTDFGAGSGNIVESDAWFAFQGPGGKNRPSSISGWGFMSPTNDLISFLNSRNDSVRAKTALLYAGAVTPSGDTLVPSNQDMPTCYNGKAYTPSEQMTPGRTNYGANNNIQILRYADVLLMNAEAKIRQGQSGDAPLKLVRNRAKLNSINGATLQNVLDERRAELANEWGERYFDLIRIDQAQNFLPGFIKGQTEFYPIPQNEIDLNPFLR